jgi:hypothetical protein
VTVITNPATGTTTRLTPGSPLYPMRLSFASSIGTVSIRDSVSGLGLTAGSLGKFYVAKDVFTTELDVSGTIGNLTAGTLRSSSVINVTGTDGRINYLETKNTLYSKVDVALDIITMKVGTDIGSKLIRTGRNFGTLTVNGSVLTGSRVTVGKTLSNLTIFKDVKAGATIKAHSITNQTVKGQISGDIIVG